MAAIMKMRRIRANAIADTVDIMISKPLLPPASIKKYIGAGKWTLV